MNLVEFGATAALLLPLLGFIALVAGGRKLGEPWAGVLATLAVAGAFVGALSAFIGLLDIHGHGRAVTVTLFEWIPSIGVNTALLVDPLSITMALFVTGVGGLIHLYSIGYMHGDQGFARFFTYLNLFTFSMLLLVLADNYLLMFVGWEGVGVCSYLLISFWFERSTAAVAGKKAFVTNRIGDAGLLLAMFLLFGTVGALDYHSVFADVDGIAGVTVTAAVLLLLVGACGKSAQLPLHVWLPDAMEGPTPVSALIHAATMVTAGVYLMVRSSPLLEHAGDATTVIAIIGAATALFAATVACAQSDIKRVLAWSTISQLGFMFLAVGSGAYIAAVFHMVTHAFFKALLFLGSGSVIHAMDDEQDMKAMGGLRALLPITSATFIIGWLAIAGIPPFAGFWSKDEVLTAAYDKSVILWAVGLLAAFLTAYYMSRQVFLVFFGKARWEESGKHPHESPRTMVLPLVVLAGASVLGGALNLPFGPHLLTTWLEPAIAQHHHEELTVSRFLMLAGITTVLSLTGIALARGWLKRPERSELEPPLLRRAWGIDDAYAAVVGGPGRATANALAQGVDAGLVDGATMGVGGLVRAGGQRLRAIQTGYVRNYAMGIAFGVVMLLGWVVSRAGG
ncbi:MAG TPA: NADH-quinone oxidoreductase subunit L [Acidimicrobiales bacterium]|nr:NADH-quinone oxidoreductase subunit L [Acidimicrobiales bacterium]